MNRNKRDRCKSLILAIIKHEQLILAQGKDSKKGQLIYLMRKGSFQVILYKMIRFLSGKLKKHTKLAKIVTRKPYGFMQSSFWVIMVVYVMVCGDL